MEPSEKREHPLSLGGYPLEDKEKKENDEKDKEPKKPVSVATQAFPPPPVVKKKSWWAKLWTSDRSVARDIRKIGQKILSQKSYFDKAYATTTLPLEEETKISIEDLRALEAAQRLSPKEFVDHVKEVVRLEHQYKLEFEEVRLLGNQGQRSYQELGRAGTDLTRAKDSLIKAGKTLGMTLEEITFLIDAEKLKLDAENRVKQAKEAFKQKKHEVGHAKNIMSLESEIVKLREARNKILVENLKKCIKEYEWGDQEEVKDGYIELYEYKNWDGIDIKALLKVVSNHLSYIKEKAKNRNDKEALHLLNAYYLLNEVEKVTESVDSTYKKGLEAIRQMEPYKVKQKLKDELEQLTVDVKGLSEKRIDPVQKAQVFQEFIKKRDELMRQQDSIKDFLDFSEHDKQDIDSLFYTLDLVVNAERDKLVAQTELSYEENNALKAPVPVEGRSPYAEMQLWGAFEKHALKAAASLDPNAEREFQELWVKIADKEPKLYAKWKKEKPELQQLEKYYLNRPISFLDLSFIERQKIYAGKPEVVAYALDQLKFRIIINPDLHEKLKDLIKISKIDVESQNRLAQILNHSDGIGNIYFEYTENLQLEFLQKQYMRPLINNLKNMRAQDDIATLDREYQKMIEMTEAEEKGAFPRLHTFGTTPKQFPVKEAFKKIFKAEWRKEIDAAYVAQKQQIDVIKKEIDQFSLLVKGERYDESVLRLYNKLEKMRNLKDFPILEKQYKEAVEVLKDNLHTRFDQFVSNLSIFSAVNDDHVVLLQHLYYEKAAKNQNDPSVVKIAQQLIEVRRYLETLDQRKINISADQYDINLTSLFGISLNLYFLEEQIVSTKSIIELNKLKNNSLYKELKKFEMESSKTTRNEFETAWCKILNEVDRAFARKEKEIFSTISRQDPIQFEQEFNKFREKFELDVKRGIPVADLSKKYQTEITQALSYQLPLLVKNKKDDPSGIHYVFWLNTLSDFITTLGIKSPFLEEYVSTKCYEPSLASIFSKAHLLSVQKTRELGAPEKEIIQAFLNRRANLDPKNTKERQALGLFELVKGALSSKYPEIGKMEAEAF